MRERVTDGRIVHTIQPTMQIRPRQDPNQPPNLILQHLNLPRPNQIVITHAYVKVRSESLHCAAHSDSPANDIQHRLVVPKQFQHIVQYPVGKGFLYRGQLRH
jgi:hypothetical protein